MTNRDIECIPISFVCQLVIFGSDDCVVLCVLTNRCFNVKVSLLCGLGHFLFGIIKFQNAARCQH